MEAYKFMFSYVTILASAGGFSAAVAAEQVALKGVTWFLTSTLLSIDDISGISNEDTILEETAREIGSDNAVKVVKGAKIAAHSVNKAKGVHSITIHLANGEKVLATWDAFNKVLLGVQIIVDKNAEKIIEKPISYTLRLGWELLYLIPISMFFWGV